MYLTLIFTKNVTRHWDWPRAKSSPRLKEFARHFRAICVLSASTYTPQWRLSALTNLVVENPQLCIVLRGVWANTLSMGVHPAPGKETTSSLPHWYTVSQGDEAPHDPWLDQAGWIRWKKALLAKIGLPLSW